MPNITGTITDKQQWDNIVVTGAFYKTTRTADWGGANSGQGMGGLGIDASRSNPIYGASNTVQPPAVALIPQIKF